jgi:H+-translocating NAD(P) transhydrogenase subunit alpha
MKLSVLKETAPNELRVAVTPDLAKKYTAAGFKVVIETGAGKAAGFPDELYKAAGAMIVAGAAEVLSGSLLLLKVQAPTQEEVSALNTGAVIISLMDPYKNTRVFDTLNTKNTTGFALELVPRTTRAQSMDVLSSQANLAGYRAVLEAATVFPKAFPMFMTAAGTISPARVFVMGAGVAGLQAIATAKRLGAIVSATDVRMAAKEQVESLGATFVMVEDEETKAAETSGGYAKEMSDAYKQKQAALISDHIKKQDIVICTALIPGRPAPVLVTEDMVKSMKPGSVIVDLAAIQGGNCPLTEADKHVEKHNVHVLGYTNMAARVAQDASQLYAKNLQNFLNLIIEPKGPLININWSDDIVRACGLTHQGKKVHPNFGGVPVEIPSQ